MIVESEEKFVWVRRQWNDHRMAKYRLSHLRNVHWSEYSGGVYAKAPQPFLHGYVQCDIDLPPFIVPPLELEFGGFSSPYELALARGRVFVLPLEPAAYIARRCVA